MTGQAKPSSLTKKSGWHWDAGRQTWLWGQVRDGCGVFYADGKAGLSRGWYYNVVVLDRDFILPFGPYPDRDRAMDAAEEEYFFQKSQPSCVKS